MLMKTKSEAKSFPSTRMDCLQKILIYFHTQEILHLGTQAPFVARIRNPMAWGQKWSPPLLLRTNGAIPLMY